MQYMYFSQTNNTAALGPKAPAALANAFADVLFLPHNAVSISSYNFIGYQGCGSIGQYCSPYTTATLTVLYQGTGLIPSINAITYAFYEAIYAIQQEQSPLGNALLKYSFPNAYHIDGYTTSSTSYTAGQPTPAPVVYRPPTRVPTPAPTVPPTREPTPAPTIVYHGTAVLNATSVGDNVTTISHLNYQPGEFFSWYIKPPTGTAKGAKLTYSVHFRLFGTIEWYDYLYVGPTGNVFQTYCSGFYCADMQFTSTTGITLQFSSNYWEGGALTGFIAQVTWQIYKPRKLLLSCQS